MATVKYVRPEDLARELNISGKLIRAYLRANFTRSAEHKNTAWMLNANQAKKVRAHFAKRSEGK